MRTVVRRVNKKTDDLIKRRMGERIMCRLPPLSYAELLEELLAEKEKELLKKIK